MSICVAAVSHAATYNWTGGSGDWNTSSANWTGAGTLWPASGTDNDAVFGVAAGTVTIPSAVTANDLTFSTDGYTVTGGSLTLNGTTPTLTTDPGVSAVISSVISGASGLVKAGSGTLSLSGANDYTGGTTLNAGLLSADHDSALGGGSLTLAGGTLRSISGNRTLANNMVAAAATSSTLLDNTGAGDLILTGGVTGSGSLTVNSTVSRSIWLQGNGSGFTGTFNYTNNNGGTNLRLGGTGTAANSLTNGSDWSGTAFVLAGATGNNRGVSWNGLAGATVKLGSLSGTGRLGIAGGNAAIWEIGALGGTQTYSGIIEGTGSGLTKVGSGTLILNSASSTYTGPTVVSSGTLQIRDGSTNSPGFMTSVAGKTMTVKTGAILDLPRLHATTVQTVTWSLPALTLEGGSTLRFRAQTGSNTHNLAAAITNSGTTTINNNGGAYAQDINLTGALSGSGTINYLATSGSGSTTTTRTLTLNNASTTYSGNWFVDYTGSTSDDFVALRSSAAGALGTGTVTLDDRARLINNTAGGINSLAGVVLQKSTSSVQLGGNDGTLQSVSGTLGNITGTAILTVNQGTFGGTVTGTGLRLVKDSPGSLTLSGANTYSGTTSVAQGVLLVNGTHTGGGLITVSGMATLGGAGTVGDVDVLDGGILAPGSVSVNSFNVQNLTLAGTSVLPFELDAPDPSINALNDYLNVAGNLTLDGILQVSKRTVPGFGTPVAGDKWLVMSVTGNVTDQILTVDGSAAPLDPGLSYVIETDTSVPGFNKVYLSVVPEAGPAGLMVLAGLILTRLRTAGK